MLLNQKYIEQVLTKDAPYRDGHGADDKFLGLGMLYYTLTHIFKAQIAVCLGSGGGFVPRMMRQAQRDLGLQTSRTIIVDDNSGRWGRPLWLAEDSFFRTEFPDIEYWPMTTDEAAKKFREQSLSLDYVHVDASHDLAFVRSDFLKYKELLSEHGVMTFHDTDNIYCGVPQVIEQIRNVFADWEVVNFRDIGTGLAIVRRVR